ncbi:MAG: alcohol dehydrogenase [Myxococcales bacterium]|nr:alcohol dehydrogenase [Myxococcales bacterium]|tara:strand:- start:450 stop:1637 length:1188 start_codon:yes stop_codon:yes gene_type:complete
MTLNNYNFPTHVVSGAGARHELTPMLKSHGVTKVLLVTDKGVATLPFFGDIAETLKRDFAVEVYSGIEGNPLISHVTAGTETAKGFGGDAVVAVGGGAAMDVAKCIALMQHHPGQLLDYEDGKPDARPVDQVLPLIIALPTTAGTGSEVGRSAVVSEDATHIKRIIFDPKLLPVHVLMDPELTLGLPATITAWTGMDACSHLSEAFLAPGYHPQCDGIALEGLRLMSQALPKCVTGVMNHETSKTYVDARHDMLNAAMMGAVAFQKGLGAVHSCAHALSTVCDLHHGLANALMIPYVMHFNLRFAEGRMKTMAEAVNAAEKSGPGWVGWLQTMNKMVGIPSSLPEQGIEARHLDALVEVAIHDPCHQTNPGPVTAENFKDIFQQAFAGTMERAAT